VRNPNSLLRTYGRPTARTLNRSITALGDAGTSLPHANTGHGRSASDEVMALMSTSATCLGGCWLRHSAHRPVRSVGGAGVQFPGSAGRFRVRISWARALRLISRAGKEGSTVSSIICDRWLILS